MSVYHKLIDVICRWVLVVYHCVKTRIWQQPDTDSETQCLRDLSLTICVTLHHNTQLHVCVVKSVIANTVNEILEVLVFGVSIAVLWLVCVKRAYMSALWWTGDQDMPHLSPTVSRDTFQEVPCGGQTLIDWERMSELILKIIFDSKQMTE